jgi:uncharacterized low-complexity protein
MKKSRAALRLLIVPSVLALAAPAAAQQGSSSTLVTAFTPSVLAAAITAIGGKQGEARVDGGKSFYTITLASGIPVVGYFGDCQAQQCKTLILVASLAKPADRSVEQLDELLRTVNNNVPAAKVFRVGDKVLVQGYVVADYGITQGNLQTQLKVFSDITLSMYQTLNPKPAG